VRWPEPGSRRTWLGGAAAVLIVLVALVLRHATADSPAPTAAVPIAAATPTPTAPPTAPTAAAPPAAGPSSAAPAPDVEACVTATVAGMSLDERVGQLLMIGAPVNGPRDLAATVTRYHLGGVFLAGRSKRPAVALRTDIAALQRAAGDTPLLIALDQEGGSVQTLKGPDFPVLASAARLGGQSTATLRDSAGDSARRLAGIGVTVNLAPVADTVPAALGERNPPIGAFHRQYGSDPDRVAAAIRTAVVASQDAGVLTTLKHFPGLGRVRDNTDTSADAVDTTATATDAYLKPFAAGIDAGSAAVMISSASYPRLDRDAIAAFSAPIITGLLRDRLGFTGLVMSDDLGAADAVGRIPSGARAVRFVRAGGDLVLTIRPQDAAPMAAALTAAATDATFGARVTDAARHVVGAKFRAGLLTCGSSAR
jgi:beta-N-acetylhexosaminidase